MNIHKEPTNFPQPSTPIDMHTQSAAASHLKKVNVFRRRVLTACLPDWLAQSKYLCWIFCRGSLKFSEELLSCVAALQEKRQICNFVWRFIADSLRCYYDDDAMTQ